MDVFVVKSGIPCFSFIFAVSKTNKNGNVFLSFFLLSSSHLTSNYSPDLIDNNSVTPLYDFGNPIYHVKEEGEEDCDLLKLARLLKPEEKVIQPHEEQCKVVIPSTAEVRKWKSRPLRRLVKNRMVALLREHVDIFVCLYQNTPEWNTNVVRHKLPLRGDCAEAGADKG